MTDADKRVELIKELDKCVRINPRRIASLDYQEVVSLILAREQKLRDEIDGLEKKIAEMVKVLKRSDHSFASDQLAIEQTLKLAEAE